ncbi:MAG TPA: cyanophycin synthetase [Zoogloea sp.]|uniref:cyanophycin synthetase n=1 Tax=Zoogloea sp. TaxID=49181 RepID=UPI002C856235|nr:cyanophycin synthetase [Zoogloea sp.]HMV18857.1 cyanophycin synthetase [Rhodocyclaceae bacterium]HMV64597.1 cyanophycin synthetase [Rhodocyclaceae bacterium]HMY48495.1 cyanophycin synthetase [Rhodocyclaceae bacterium]HMZ77645.1 cyanophycin synthetase [Rhodocyclaceae bacterium]HNA68212.1 cyanophycin synthetase [Rhodocyclaceae bacterium]
MTNKTIEFLNVFHLRGPNIWTYRAVLEAWVDIHDLEDCPSNVIPGFYERLTALLPSLIEHRCSIGERGGFLKRLRDGTWPGHILEHVTLELQNLAGMSGGFGKARETSDRGVYKVVIRAWQKDVSLAALHMGRDLLMAAIEGRPYDVDAAVRRLRDLVDKYMLGPSTRCIVEAAADKDRRIPYIRLSEGNLVQLGYGARQRRIWTAETDRTSAIAESISREKDLTKSLLESCGVPVPEGRIVTSPEDAIEAAGDIGYPVVVKPSDGNHARGVFTNISTPDEVAKAFPLSLAQGSEVIVERFVRGSEHRLLVVGGRMVAANKGDTVSVVGDGKHTIDQLIDLQINSDPRRGDEHEFPLYRITLDRFPAAQMEVERQGYTGSSIPPDGQDVMIVRTSNMAFDVTDQVHPDTAELACLAARIVGLDIAGVDLVCEDISLPLGAQKGAIVEVNAGPGLLMHIKPGVGEPRPVGEAIVAHLFEHDADSRIPVVGVTGSRGKTPVARLVTHLLRLSGQYTGLASSEGVFLDGRQVETPARTNWDAAERVLMNRSVDVAVFENGCRSILSDGTVYDRCLVGVVTNVDAPLHYGEFYMDAPEKVWNVFRTQVDLVLPQGAAVLNAEDPAVVEMAELSDGEVIFYGVDGQAPAIAQARSEGKRTVYVSDGAIVLATGDKAEAVARLNKIAMLRNGAGERPGVLSNLLAAVAAAWALGVAPALIRAGVKPYDPNAPLRND